MNSETARLSSRILIRNGRANSSREQSSGCATRSRSASTLLAKSECGSRTPLEQDCATATFVWNPTARRLTCFPVTVAVVDFETNAPVAANVEAHFSFDDGKRQVMSFDETDESGQVTFSGYPDGVASLSISARGYRAEQLDLELRGGRVGAHTVRLVRTEALTGRVASSEGVPIGGALITGGYEDELQNQGRFETRSDAEGRFRFDSPPNPGTTFYVVAPGWALGIANLEVGAENIVTLSRPASSVLHLTEDNAPPAKVYRVIAAPSGGSYIPSGVLDELAQANGMTPYQLLGSASDGAIVLPAFLGPGTYDFFITRKGGRPFLYDRVGRVTLPADPSAFLRISK